MQITIQNQVEFAKSFQREGVSPPLYLGPLATAEIPPSSYLDYEPDFAAVTNKTRPVDGQCRLMVDGQVVQADVLSKAFRDGTFGPEMQAKAEKLDKARGVEAARLEKINADSKR